VFITNGLDDIVLESQLTKGQWCPMGFISLHSQRVSDAQWGLYLYTVASSFPTPTGTWPSLCIGITSVNLYWSLSV